jgi:hypothetical protein
VAYRQIWIASCGRALRVSKITPPGTVLADAKNPAIHSMRVVAATPMVMTGLVAESTRLAIDARRIPAFFALAAGLEAAGSQRTDPPASRTQSGQRTPPGVRIWHSGQIVRPQRWHSVQLVRSGWR